jgi:hypothetical protein
VLCPVILADKRGHLQKGLTIKSKNTFSLVSFIQSVNSKMLTEGQCSYKRSEWNGIECGKMIKNYNYGW